MTQTAVLSLDRIEMFRDSALSRSTPSPRDLPPGAAIILAIPLSLAFWAGVLLWVLL